MRDSGKVERTRWVETACEVSGGKLAGRVHERGGSDTYLSRQQLHLFEEQRQRLSSCENVRVKTR